MTPVEFVLTVSAVTGAISGLGALAWKIVIRPHLQTAVFAAFHTSEFREEVGQIVEARLTGALAPVVAEMSMNGGRSMKDVLNRLEVDVRGMNQRMDDHLRLHV